MSDEKWVSISLPKGLAERIEKIRKYTFCQSLGEYIRDASRNQLLKDEKYAMEIEDRMAEQKKTKEDEARY